MKVFVTVIAVSVIFKACVSYAGRFKEAPGFFDETTFDLYATSLPDETTAFLEESFLPFPVDYFEEDCRNPGPIEHGSNTAGNRRMFSRGDRINYKCDPGYVLNGEDSIYCGYISTYRWDSKWFPKKVPKCLKEEADFADETTLLPYEPTTSIDEAEVKGYGRERESKKASSEEAPDFFDEITHSSLETTVFPDEITTLYEEDFLPFPIDYFPEFDCRNPGPIEHGSNTAGSWRMFSLGDRINYTCDPGYVLNGENYIYCDDTSGFGAYEAWYPMEVPKCLKAEDYQCLIRRGTCKDYRYSICAAGYAKDLCGGNNNRRCCLKCNITCENEERDASKMDDQCKAEGGHCFHITNYCSGSYVKGKCGGNNERRCCVTNEWHHYVLDLLRKLIREYFRM